MLGMSIPGTDVAVIRMGLWELHNHDIDYVFFRSDVHGTSIRQLRAHDCAEGDPIFILGFEAGLPEIRRTSYCSLRCNCHQKTCTREIRTLLLLRRLCFMEQAEVLYFSGRHARWFEMTGLNILLVTRTRNHR